MIPPGKHALLNGWEQGTGKAIFHGDASTDFTAQQGSLWTIKFPVLLSLMAASIVSILSADNGGF